jgi:hypothetical protein
MVGMFDCFLHGCARSKPEMLKTAKWFRMAAHQGLAEAQWELGEWFHRGLFCDFHVPFARQYIRRPLRRVEVSRSSASHTSHLHQLGNVTNVMHAMNNGGSNGRRWSRLYFSGLLKREFVIRDDALFHILSTDVHDQTPSKPQ